MLKKMKALAKEKDIGVLATVAGTEPHCSLMAYATNEECTEIYMISYTDTHKFKNMMENSFVSLMIDTRDESASPRLLRTKALTISGVFERLEEEEKKAFVRRKLLERHPYLKEFINQPHAEPFVIKVSSFLLLEGLTKSHFEAIKTV
jgi:nitroimidazol reductase NimA-like FMN-containing flavoprotein (pyridoxamine 5'-phosphate oxidase superfamily)